MKKILIIMFILSIISINFSYSKCDWNTIKQTKEGFLYSKECHIQVGKIVRENELRQEQVDKLNKSIKLKDLAIETAENRIEKWRNTSYSLEDRIIKQDKWSNYGNLLYFGGGIITTILTGWALGQINR